MILSWLSARRIAILSLVTVLITITLWSLLWTVGAVQYRAYIDGWIASHRTQGYQVSYDTRDTMGFPGEISLHYSNFVLQSPDGVKIHANDVSLSAFPWHWNDLEAKLKHGFDLSIPFTDLKTLSIRSEVAARNHTKLDANGDWLFVDLELEQANAVWGETPFFTAGKFEVAMQRPDRAPKDRHDTGLTVTARTDNLTMPNEYAGPFGPHVQNVDASMRVMGPVPDPRLKESVEAWNASGGTVEFDKFFLSWGALLLQSKGTLGLDDELQPEGAFSAAIGNSGEVIKVLLASGAIPQRQTAMLDSALDLFTKKTVVEGHDGIEAPLAVQLGGFFLGPVRIFEFPEIEWPHADPAAPSSPTQ